jgi:hypothetical protein
MAIISPSVALPTASAAPAVEEPIHHLGLERTDFGPVIAGLPGGLDPLQPVQMLG